MTPDAPGLFWTINDFARSTPWLHPPMIAIAKYGIGLFAVLLLIGWWRARSRPAQVMAAALIAPLSAVVALAANQVLVNHFAEARPYQTYPDTLVLISKTTDAAFPSDHATVAGAVTVALVLVSWRLGLITAACAVVLAFARVYCGVHYPADVIAGLAVGAAIALALWALLRVPVTWLVERGRTTGLRPLFVRSERLSAAAVPTGQ